MISLKWFGHSMWKVWNEKISIITDPFTDIGYPLPKNETADIVISSHDHFDHNNFALIKGSFQKITQAGDFEFKGMKFKTFQTYHDDCCGKKRGTNLLIRFELDNKIILHCGDIGHDLEDSLIEKIGKVDLLFIPVGGFFTIDAETAHNITNRLKPNIICPMHYKTDVLDFPISKIDEFLKFYKNIKHVDSNQYSLTEQDFTDRPILVLKYL